jgi:hypothetical protein
LLQLVVESVEGNTKLAAVPVSDGIESANVELLHAAVSVLVTVAVYVTVPPGVTDPEVGLKVTVGAVLVHAAAVIVMAGVFITAENSCAVQGTAVVHTLLVPFVVLIAFPCHAVFMAVLVMAPNAEAGTDRVAVPSSAITPRATSLVPARL